MIRLGIVGLASYYGPAYAGVAAERGDVTVGGVVGGEVSDEHLETLSRPTREEFASTHDCHVFDSVTELIADGSIDAAIIATQLDRRADHAVQCLDAGIPVLTAKPIADSPAGADRVAAAAYDADIPASTTSPMRYDSTIQSVASRIADGAIGDILRAEITIQHNPFLEHGIEYNPESAPDQAGTAYTIGYYGADGLLWLTDGSPDRVFAEYANLNTPYLPHPDIGVATVRFDTGVIGSMSMTVTTRIREYQQWEVEVIGTDGILTTQRTGYTAYQWDHNATQPEAFGRSMDSVLENQLAAFIEAVKSDGGPEAVHPNPSTAARGIALCSAWEQSAKSTSPVYLEN